MTTKTKAQIEQLNNRRGNGQFDTKQYSESNLSLDTPLLARTSADSVYTSVHADPDDKLEEFCDLNPDLPTGKARSILHQFSSHLEKYPASEKWEETMAQAIARESKPIHQSFVMSPSKSDVDVLRQDVFWANQPESGDNRKRIMLEFHSKVPHLDAEESDSAFNASLALLKINHEDWVKPLEDATRENAAAQGHDFDYSYTPPGSTAEKGTYGQASKGDLYTGYRDITSINKDARAEFKRAQKAGYIPRSLKFSVTGDKYSGGQSMSVNVTGVDQESLVAQDEGRLGRYSPEGKELNRRISSIAEAWNRDDSEAMVDYFDNTYYCHVNLRE